MILDNGILHLELCNKGGEMSRLLYRGYDVLYRGDGKYWSGKNPTLFPMISSPNTKQYTYEGKTYPCRNHGLIRYSDLETVCDDGSKVVMKLQASDETLKEYPFNFTYQITYRLDNNKVLIDYAITNNDIKQMPFTFGLHPGFIVRNFTEMSLLFDDEYGTLISETKGVNRKIELKEYKNFINDVNELDTVIFKDLTSKQVTLIMKEYNVKVDISNFKYLALWNADRNADYICIEPWLSINDIKEAENPFDSKYELEYLKPNETFRINYYIELC